MTESDINVFVADAAKRLHEMGDTCTLRRIHNAINPPSSQLLEELLEHLWELLHSFYWKDVPQIYRELYAMASLLLFTSDPINASRVERIQALRKADLGILLGSPCKARERLQEVAQKLHESLVEEDECQPMPSKRHKPNSSATSPPTVLPVKSLSGRTPIKHVYKCTIFEFNVQYFLPQCPVVLHGAIDHWCGLTKWSCISALRRAIGYRTVPVETGRSYLDENAGQRLMSVGEFLDQYLLETNEQGGYLAQHCLADQIPILWSDFSLPDYTALSTPDASSFGGSSNAPQDDPVVSFWLGPSSSLTPLHFDLAQNLLVQICGYKYIRLYPPTATSEMRPLSGLGQSNSSSINLLEEELKGADFIDTLLGPGEMLFIPKGYWHFVQGVGRGVSVDGRVEGSGVVHSRGLCQGDTPTGPASCMPQSGAQESEETGCSADYCLSVSFWWERQQLDEASA